MSLTSQAKKLLAETIRGTQQDPEKGLRAKLLRAIHDEGDRRYRLSVPIAKAGLDEAHHTGRARIEARIEEQTRAEKPKNAKETSACKARFRTDVEKKSAATLINRLVLLRQLEAAGLSKPAVVTGGWDSKGYREFREFAPGLCNSGSADATEGYATLLQLLFDELAIDLPGLYGDVGLTKLFAVPPATLREVIERLDAAELLSAWTDDTTLGWVYQYWNDPDREALDAKINDGGKIEPHEIACKTQMFTERYMVEWLLQNSLGLTWLAICKKNSWTADAERVLPVLEARRVAWRKRREAGEVELDALMPISGELEEHWKYYVPQPIPDDAIDKARDSVVELKILDPACGSGHFLVTAFGMLAALYKEEARHRKQPISDREIAESILEHNLHGIDIDPRAIQIAAAGLYLKSKSFAKDACARQINLVAPVLGLSKLAADDPAVVQLRHELKREAGIAEELTSKLIASLAGVDYLGSLLKVDAALNATIAAHEQTLLPAAQRAPSAAATRQRRRESDRVRLALLTKLEHFLAQHSRSGDLGLRLGGEQLAAGVRFVRIAREGAYDVVVGNPPYQALGKTEGFGYVATSYPRGRTDLYAAFLERALDLARPGGVSASLTMRGWMFLTQFMELREHLLLTYDLRALGDFDRGAFEEVPNEVLAVVAVVIRRATGDGTLSVATQPTRLDDKSYDRQRTNRKRAAVLDQTGRYEFAPRGFKVIEGEPIVYWWTKAFLKRYADAPKLGAESPARKGLCTGDDGRFTRFWWEINFGGLKLLRCKEAGTPEASVWAPTIKGGKGRVWFEPLIDVVRFEDGGLELQVMGEQPKNGTRFQNRLSFFQPGVAFAMIGSSFSARAHRYRSVFGNAGSSIFPDNVATFTCLMNSGCARFVLESLNPTVNFEVGDVNRLAVFPVEAAESIFAKLDAAFSKHEASREPSVEFKRAGASAWLQAQEWAQGAIDRAAGEALPSYAEAIGIFLVEDHLSFAIGITIGRFDPNGGGILDQAPRDALPAGILFISADGNDSLDHPACKPLLAQWSQQEGKHTETKDYTLNEYLRKAFFPYHKKLYENRPIYFPLSSDKKSFVAFASIHRWQDDTLNVLLADHLMPTHRRLEGELADLRTARATGSNKGKAEKRFAEVQKLLEELNEFIANVTAIAGNGPPPSDEKTQKRERNAKYAMDLDDGVMVNGAALWPLLEPQWKDPKKWWKELANAQGKKDYDWSHLAARYFPTRVRAKCQEDPSLAVAHHCFWSLHPEKAYAWELRLQDEIKPTFTIDEPGSDAARTKLLSKHKPEAKAIQAAELKRRERKASKQDPDQDEPTAPPVATRVKGLRAALPCRPKGKVA